MDDECDSCNICSNCSSSIYGSAVFSVFIIKPLMPSYHLRTLVEGFVRIGIFILYIALIQEWMISREHLCTMRGAQMHQLH